MVGKEQEDDRDDDQGEDGGGQEAADDDPGHGDAGFGAGGHGEGHGCHADHHGDGGHEDRLEADAAGFDDGFEGAVASVHQGQCVVDKQCAVLGDDAVHDEDADHGEEIEGVVREEEHEDGADEAERQGEHADEGCDGGFVEDGEQHVDEDEGEEER